MFLRALALAAPLTMITACTGAMEAGPAAAPATTTTATPWTVYQGGASPSPSGSFTPDLMAAGTFQPYREGSTAITYDPAVVPAGAAAQVEIATTPAGLRVRLTASGMLPGRAYGAHLHTEPCAATPAAAGPHYQHQHDPAAATSPPSVDPAYANPKNEVWLDFTAAADGTASAVSEQDWSFPAGGSARSLIIHTSATHTAAGEAGTAGARVACLTLPAR